MMPGAAPFDWGPIRLLVFDMDGTLYRQQALRLAMARALLAHAIARRDTETLSIIGSYRRLKESLADAETPDFEPVLLAGVAARHKCTPAQVAAIIADWIETRPLPLLANARVRGVETVFARARASGRRIGVLSDYPATAKLAALGLAADFIVAASDPDIALMKPHPRGLQSLVQRAGVTAAQTVMIGDRPERDGAAAHRAGTAVLIRRRRPLPGWRCFADFTDPLFDGLML
jgi:putative hydrolase of the HAD superfamily